MISSRRLGEVKRQHLMALFLFFGIFAFWVWRIHYGGADIYDCVDESFYTSIPYRMLFGDMLLYDEMNTTQLAAFLIFPFVKVRDLIFQGNTEGIILFFRYVWLVCHMAVSAVIYLLGSKKGYRFSLYAALIYSLSVPLSLAVLSYNTITCASATLLALLYYLKYDSVPANIAKGFLLAMMVLCNPYCLLIYLVIVVLTVINRFVSIDEQLSFKSLLMLHIGILLLLLPFVVYFAVCMHQRGLSIADVVNNLMTMVSYDKAHDAGGTFLTYIKPKFWFIRIFVHTFPLFLVLFFGIMAFGLIKKKYRDHCIIAVMVLAALYSVYALFTTRSNYILSFGAFIGLAVLIFKFNIIRKRSVMGWVVAILFIVAVDFCSNNALLAVSWSCTVLSVLAYLMLEDGALFEKANAETGKSWKRGIFCIAACMIALCILGMDVRYVYHDEPIPELTAQISEGPMKGIHTTEERAEWYTDIYRELKALPLSEDDTVLTFPTSAIDLFTLQREVCSPSTWFTVREQPDHRLDYYYQKHPDKIPSVIFINKKMFELEDTDALKDKGYIIEKDNEVCTVLRKVQKNTP